MRALTVKEDGKLLEYLFKALADTKKTRVRQFLKSGSVSVNGKAVTRFDHPVRPGDEVRVRSARELRSDASLQHGIGVVYEDDAVLVIMKPSGLLTIATETVQQRTAFYAANDHVLQKETARLARDRRGPERRLPAKKQIFIVHRLDKDASGLLVFAKDIEIKQKLQSGWKDVTKKYYAVVEGVPERKSGTVTSYLRENKFLEVYSTKHAGDAKLSVTHYRVLRSSPHYSLLEVELGTGRKHQIRVHLSDLGHPIAGDKRYGAKTDPAGRLALHAFYLSFPHPLSGKPVTCATPIPGAFEQVLKADAEAAVIK